MIVCLRTVARPRRRGTATWPGSPTAARSARPTASSPSWCCEPSARRRRHRRDHGLARPRHLRRLDRHPGPRRAHRLRRAPSRRLPADHPLRRHRRLPQPPGLQQADPSTEEDDHEVGHPRPSQDRPDRLPVADPPVHRPRRRDPLRPHRRGPRRRRTTQGAHGFDAPGAELRPPRRQVHLRGAHRRLRPRRRPGAGPPGRASCTPPTSTPSSHTDPLGPGLLAIGLGGLDVEADDHRLLERASFVYDALYAWCRPAGRGRRRHDRAPRLRRPPGRHRPPGRQAHGRRRHHRPQVRRAAVPGRQAQLHRDRHRRRRRHPPRAGRAGCGPGARNAARRSGSATPTSPKPSTPCCSSASPTGTRPTTTAAPAATPPAPSSSTPPSRCATTPPSSSSPGPPATCATSTSASPSARRPRPPPSTPSTAAARPASPSPPASSASSAPTSPSACRCR